MTFTEYLQQKRLAPHTVNSYSIYVKYFTDWLGQEQLADAFTYNDLLGFIRYLNDMGKSKAAVHSLLCIVRHYCNYLIVAGRRTDNPAAGVYIKGLVRKLPTHLLSMEELEALYQQYSIQLNVEKTKKIMLGLIVYQGLGTGELTRLQVSDMKLKEGKVFIRGTEQSNERWLKLEVTQVVVLQQYMEKNKFKEGALLQSNKRGYKSETNVRNQVNHMFRQLRQLNPKVINIMQLCNSVLTHWLRQHHLRQVQYMAGHKYVSSTQRYQVNNMDELRNELDQHHPMA